MKKQVLLIDDSVTIHRVIDLSIDNEKYEVTKVFSKEDAALKLMEMLYDFILLDNKLDNIVLVDYVPFLKSRSVGSKVILLVGAFDKFDIADLDRTGADDYLVKPFDSQSLNAKLLLSADDMEYDSGDNERSPIILQDNEDDNEEGAMPANFVDGLAIADAMREDSPIRRIHSPKPVNEGLGISADMLSGSQYLASLESEDQAVEDDGYHEDNALPETEADDVSSVLDALAESDEMLFESEDMQHMLGALDPASTIRDDGDMTSEEASALEFLENENMKSMPATEDDIDNAQYAEDTLLGLEYMDPVISCGADTFVSDIEVLDEEIIEIKSKFADEDELIGITEENEDHINNEQEIARIYGLDEPDSVDSEADNDFGLAEVNYDTLPFDDTEEGSDVEFTAQDSEFDEFEQCLDVMGADLAADAAAESETLEPVVQEECEDYAIGAPADEASGAGEDERPLHEMYATKAPDSNATTYYAPEKPAATTGGITVTISRDEIMALVGQAIDKRFLEEAIKTVLAENLREVVRTIVPAIAEKYIKEEIERLKDE